ncbi:TetR/AcrR family transcriptional regulator [Shewanella sp. VB17]|uniref:TetR/AcrR family transcriptional regulator n=1 Tax=Shewanella sp. VB17 TaxID=2739432 RepID=UPI001566212E|nr:TetR/AcrR family transcriptional regulator [Shewanella sp. VB17]NRD74410.1 TetR/AcrR family transcriptional regulator [Shewanella sp. VB17]
MSKRTAKEKLLEAAADLFYNNGITATGIDTITAKAKVAKMSLYNNFSSKSDLIAAYLKQRHEEWLSLYEKQLLGTSTPQEAILAIFDAYRNHAEHEYEKGFRGCGLLNAAAELPAGSEGRRTVRGHKQAVEDILFLHIHSMLTDDQRARDLSEQLSFILEGSIARAGLEGNSDKLLSARRIAKKLIEREIK